ncbi:Sulfur reduction protein DsrE [Candidatus Hydrogenisulfobacillus filiaventi]|uniref:Sulfur reduction protein DsrE n=1 Tax=Candidatus Hydrogenisulfobacillus filiaventi TaxID=2707344 RepID=A0A6F8ZFM6_9FIRM|nr:DsrE family protein [Bacillota bacterium]CAB1128681.1 Sulfur reduction protein DsrE [Candidatus Hydrogenisulfobacillus filiaventi]
MAGETVKKYLYIVTTGVEAPERSASPFFLATTAALMEAEATMVFTITGTSLLKKGVAEQLHIKPRGESAVLATFIAQAREAGVRFLVCAPSLDLNDLTLEDLIEVDGVVGGTALNQMADEADVVITF